MLKILFLNLVALFVCFAMGVVFGLSAVYSPWWLLLCPIFMFFGWIPFAELSKKMNYNLNEVSIVIFLDFFLSIAALLLFEKYFNGSKFLGITIATGLFSTAITSIIHMFKLRWLWYLRA